MIAFLAGVIFGLVCGVVIGMLFLDWFVGEELRELYADSVFSS